jgi:hypothetical protein
MYHTRQAFQLALGAAVALALLATPAQAQPARKAGRVLVTNRTAEPVTITCVYYLDAAGNRQSVRGGGWTVRPGQSGYLDDLGMPFRASHFELTLGTRAGSTGWHLNHLNFDAAGNLCLWVDGALLARHQARLAPVARPPVVMRPNDPAVKRALGKVLGAAITHAVASEDDRGELGRAIAIALAARLRNELIESALTDLFPGQPERDIRAARQVICLALDGKLSRRNLDRLQARDEALAKLRAINPDMAAAASFADFVAEVAAARNGHR